MEEFSGRVAVVTGAASGIGRALAGAFAAEGCGVVLADVESDALDATTGELLEVGAQVMGARTDVTDSDSVRELAEMTIERFGRVDILCNNAGVGGGGLIRGLQLVDWKWVIDVSLWGVVHGLHHFLPHLVESDDAHVVSTASVAGLMANPGLGPYNAAKYGVVAIMETLHHEMVADDSANVGVSVLCPGEVSTNITSSQRNRPEHLRRSGTRRPPTDEARQRNAAIAAALAEDGMDPADVAALVLDAIRERRFWVLSHPDYLADIRHRNESLHQQENPTLLRGAFGT
ncbi:MAG: SDR family NAD(P)-dependent oxidoreductase [Actinomycetota bacterium]